MTNLRELLTSPLDFMAPEKSLEGLSDADAARREPGINHSIAEIVAHMSFWQDWFHARCMGQPIPVAESAAVGWPMPDSWPSVRSRFVDRLQQLAVLADGDLSKPIAPAIDFPAMAQYTVSDVLIHVATHNAHHLGQVIVLRQLMGVWPPPSGSYTW